MDRGTEWASVPGVVSESLLQSGSGGRPIYKVSVKGEFTTMKHSFYKRFFDP